MEKKTAAQDLGKVVKKAKVVAKPSTGTLATTPGAACSSSSSSSGGAAGASERPPCPATTALPTVVDDEEDECKEFDELCNSGTKDEKEYVMCMMLKDVDSYVKQVGVCVSTGLYSAGRDFVERAGDVLIMAKQVLDSLPDVKPGEKYTETASVL